MLLASARLTSVKQQEIGQQLQLLVGALILGGVAISGLSLLHSPLAALVLVPLVGMSSALFTPLLWALLQEMTPQHLLGRVMTMVNTAAMAASTVGMTLCGWATDTLGTSVSLITIGLMLLGTAVAIKSFLPQLAECRATQEAFSNS